MYSMNHQWFLVKPAKFKDPYRSTHVVVQFVGLPVSSSAQFCTVVGIPGGVPASVSCSQG
eukprot:7605350-Karenia_brevis.AAC.1